MLELEPVLPVEPVAVMPSPATPRPAAVFALLTLPVLVSEDETEESPVDAPVLPEPEIEPVPVPVDMLLLVELLPVFALDDDPFDDEEPFSTPLLVPAGSPSAPVPAVCVEPCVAVEPLSADVLLLVPLVLPPPELEADDPLVCPEPPPAATCDAALPPAACSPMAKPAPPPASNAAAIAAATKSLPRRGAAGRASLLSRAESRSCSSSPSAIG